MKQYIRYGYILFFQIIGGCVLAASSGSYKDRSNCSCVRPAPGIVIRGPIPEDVKIESSSSPVMSIEPMSRVVVRLLCCQKYIHRRCAAQAFAKANDKKNCIFCHRPYRKDCVLIARVKEFSKIAHCLCCLQTLRQPNK